MNIYLVAHTEVYNPNNILLGKNDFPLVENFTTAFSCVEDLLNGTGNSNTYYSSSPQRHCLKLAHYLSNNSTYIDDNFIQINMGEWEYAEQSNITPDRFYDLLKTGFSNGENIDQVKKRVGLGLKSLIKKKADNIVLVTTPLIIKVIIADVIKAGFKSLKHIEVDYGSVSCLAYIAESKSITLKYCNLRNRI